MCVTSVVSRTTLPFIDHRSAPVPSAFRALLEKRTDQQLRESAMCAKGAQNTTMYAKIATSLLYHCANSGLLVS